MNPLIKKERNQSTFSSDDSGSRTKFFGLARYIQYLIQFVSLTNIYKIVNFWTNQLMAYAICRLFNWASAYLEFCIANSNCKNWFTIFFLKITICMYMISLIYIPCSVIVNNLINIEHTFRSIIFDFYQRPIYVIEYMVNPVKSTIERIGNRVHIIQTGAGGAETARAITDQPVTLVGETEAAAGAGAPIEPSKVVVVVIIGIYFIWVMTKGTIEI